MLALTSIGPAGERWECDQPLCHAMALGDVNIQLGPSAGDRCVYVLHPAQTLPHITRSIHVALAPHTAAPHGLHPSPCTHTRTPPQNIPSIDVWISSPVRSKKPVLMNTIRSLAWRMHSLRLTVVRRSSSIMPTCRVYSEEGGGGEHENVYSRSRYTSERGGVRPPY